MVCPRCSYCAGDFFLQMPIPLGDDCVLLDKRIKFNHNIHAKKKTRWENIFFH